MLKLFYAPGTCALASRIALEDARAEHEIVRVDFSRQQQHSAEFLKINPKGRVPALSTDGGILTETPAILTFIAQSFPDAGLAPLVGADAVGGEADVGADRTGDGEDGGHGAEGHERAGEDAREGHRADACIPGQATPVPG